MTAPPRSGAVAPASVTILAFVTIVVLGGVNGVTVRISNQELAPFWGATLRFGIAAVVLFGLVGIRRVQLPKGAALAGSLLYGAVAFGGAFGFMYWALVRTPAGVGQVILALVPLLTLLFAVGEGLEHLSPQSLMGSLVALGGIAVIFGERIGAAVPLASLLAVLAASVCMAASNVIVKRFPKSHPIASNAVAMATGATILLAASLVAGEAHALPGDARTWAAVAYVSLAGSVAVFSLFLYVIARWTASATSYVMLLMPIVTVVAAAVILGEPITAGFLVGGVIVLGGVYLGAFAPHFLGRPRLRPAAVPGQQAEPMPLFVGSQAPALDQNPSATPLLPGCA